MAAHIKKCPGCGSYTLKDNCGKCSMKTIEPRPPKYSPEDKWGRFRRETKQCERDKEGLT
jgi:H/ACA ribonucleoprotein complex subunit 3